MSQDSDASTLSAEQQQAVRCSDSLYAHVHSTSHSPLSSLPLTSGLRSISNVDTIACGCMPLYAGCARSSYALRGKSFAFRAHAYMLVVHR